MSHRTHGQMWSRTREGALVGLGVCVGRWMLSWEYVKPERRPWLFQRPRQTLSGRWWAVSTPRGGAFIVSRDRPAHLGLTDQVELWVYPYEHETADPSVPIRTSTISRDGAEQQAGFYAKYGRKALVVEPGWLGERRPVS